MPENGQQLRPYRTEPNFFRLTSRTGCISSQRNEDIATALVQESCVHGAGLCEEKLGLPGARHSWIHPVPANSTAAPPHAATARPVSGADVSGKTYLRKGKWLPSSEE